MRIHYTPSFLRKMKKLEKSLREEAFDKIKLFEQDPQSYLLKTHKLHGKLDGRYSFSVNYQTRIIFIYINTQEVAFLGVGNHDMYK